MKYLARALFENKTFLTKRAVQPAQTVKTSAN